MTRTAEHKLAWGFGLSLALLTANALVSYSDLADLVANTGHVVTARRILETVEDIASGFKDAETARRGFLIDGNAIDLNDFKRQTSTIVRAIANLEELVRDRPEQWERFVELKSFAEARLNEFRATLVKAQASGADVTRAGFGDDPVRRHLGQLYRLTDDFEEAEERHWERRVNERRSGIFRAFITF